MRDHDIKLIIKGYRNNADLEYEKIQAEWNKKHGGYDTEFWESASEFKDISSTSAREKLKNGESANALLSEKVIEFIRNR